MNLVIENATLDDAIAIAGVQVTSLRVANQGQALRRFYSAVGFEPDGNRRVFVERPDASISELRYARGTSQDEE